MRSKVIYVVVCALAAALPLFPMTAKQRRDVTAQTNDTFPGWPSSFEGHSLTPLPLSERERRFGENFPGRVARFTDGTREIIIRQVTEPTRKLHPASDCFNGAGYAVRPLPLHVDDAGQRWGSFTATRRAERLRVRERIYDEDGRNWTDASSWYWAAIAGDTRAPWWTITVAEKTMDD